MDQYKHICDKRVDSEDHDHSQWLESVRIQNDLKRENCNIIGAIRDNNPCKELINEMENFTVNFVREIDRNLNVGNDLPLFLSNITYYVMEDLSREGELLVFAISLPTIVDRNELTEVPMAYAGVLSISDDKTKVHIGDVHSLCIADSSKIDQDSLGSSKGIDETGCIADSSKIDQDSLGSSKGIDETGIAKEFQLMLQVHRYIMNGDAYSALKALQEFSDKERDTLYYAIREQIKILSENKSYSQVLQIKLRLCHLFELIPKETLDSFSTRLGEEQKELGIFTECCNNSAVKYQIMLALHKYITDDSVGDHLQELKDLMPQDKAALSLGMSYEIQYLSENYSYVQSSQIKLRLGYLFKIIPRDTYDKILSNFRAGLNSIEEHYKKTENRYLVTYVLEKLVPTLISLVAILKLHMVQYCMAHIPALIAIAFSVHLAYGYIVAMTVVATIATALLAYYLLNCLANIICTQLHDKYFYKEFCKDFSLIEFTIDAFIDFSISVRDAIGAPIKRHYEFATNQSINKIRELAKVLHRYSIVKVIQYLFLAGALLALFLPAHQLICSMVMLSGYVIISCALLIPYEKQIIIGTGSRSRAMSAKALISCCMSRPSCYSYIADLLGYNEVNDAPANRPN